MFYQVPTGRCPGETDRYEPRGRILAAAGETPAAYPASSEPRACSRTGNGFLPSRLSGDQDDKSPVTGDCYAGICGSPGLKCPGPPDRSPEALVALAMLDLGGMCPPLPGRAIT